MTREIADADASPTAIHGWSCGEPEQQAPCDNKDSFSSENTKHFCCSALFKKGWRRNALHGILLLLMLLVFLNIALTLWIISALKLSVNGIGPIKIVNGGIHLEGNAWITDQLVTSSISSPSPVTLHSHRNFTVLVTEPNHLEHAKLMIKRDVVRCEGQSFEVRDGRGGNVFRASRDEVRVFAEALAVDGSGGITVRSAVQTPLVRAPPGTDLQLESLTRGLDLRAPQSIYLESRAGGIDITSHTDIKLGSVVGAIKIDAPNIILGQLKEATLAEKPQKVKNVRVYQLCACASGKLFLAAADGVCVIYDNNEDLCR